MKTLAEIAAASPGSTTLAGIAMTAVGSVMLVMGITMLVASMWYSYK